MYKMVVADLDGTIVHNAKISDKSKQTIEKLRKQGVIFTLATGRHFNTAKIVLDELNMKGPIITVNGTMIVDSETGKEISTFTLPDKKVFEILKLLRKNNYKFIITTTTDVMGDERSVSSLMNVISERAKKHIKICTFNEMLENIDSNVLKVLVVEEDKEVRKETLRNIKTIDNIDIIFSHETFIDCISPGVSKGKALESLAAYYDVKISEIMSIGDQENDKEMIERAGLGVAMGNANNKVKFVADFITSDVRDDGFTFACEMFVLED